MSEPFDPQVQLDGAEVKVYQEFNENCFPIQILIVQELLMPEFQLVSSDIADLCAGTVCTR